MKRSEKLCITAILISYFLIAVFLLYTFSQPPLAAVEVVPLETEAELNAKLKQCGSALIINKDGTSSCYYTDWQKKEIKKYGKTNVFKRK